MAVAIRFTIDVISLWDLASIVYCSLLIHFCCGHPQCLDFRAPFEAEVPLSFCASHKYSDVGCCTLNDDRKLQNHYTSIENRIPAKRRQQWNGCRDYIKTFLCQTCSPYAAHIFDSVVSQNEAVTEQRKFPGLCKPYCFEFYQFCREFTQDYLDEMGSSQEERARINSATDQFTFCSDVTVTDGDYCYPELLTNSVLNGNIIIEQVTKEGCICVENIMSKYMSGKLRNPILLKHADDGSKRMFVGEQIGLVHIYYPDGTRLPTPFLDIQQKIIIAAQERGLLGMAFHPRYKENGKFYTYYTTPLASYEAGKGIFKVRIEEGRVSPTDPNRADVSHSKITLEVIQPFYNHNGGEFLFGDDNDLYIFLGDGGSGGDPLRDAQNMTRLIGKVLRIDVDVPPFSKEAYRIPPDNPFADGVNALPEIYAYGLRNMWRCGKDRGDPVTGAGKGRIVCGDVGQEKREELDLIEKGANYGWNRKEGFKDYCRFCPRGLPNIKLTYPIHQYPHWVGKSVTGGHFYRGCHSPNLNGFYIYGDFVTGRLYRLLYDDNAKTWNNKELTMCGSDRCTPPLDNTYSPKTISFGEDEDGEIYMLTTDVDSTTAFDGTIYRIVDPSRRVSPAKCGSARPDQVITTTTTPVTTSMKTLVTTPKRTAVTTPKSTPVTTPKRTLMTTPKRTPGTTPKSTPVTTPKSTPVTTPTTPPVTTKKDTSAGVIPIFSGMLQTLMFVLAVVGCMP